MIGHGGWRRFDIDLDKKKKVAVVVVGNGRKRWRKNGDNKSRKTDGETLTQKERLLLLMIKITRRLEMMDGHRIKETRRSFFIFFFFFLSLRTYDGDGDDGQSVFRSIDPSDGTCSPLLAEEIAQTLTFSFPPLPSSLLPVAPLPAFPSGFPRKDNMDVQMAEQQGYGAASDHPYAAAQAADGPLTSESAAPADLSTVADSAVSNDGERGNNGADGNTESQTHIEEPTVLTEEDRLWNVVKANPADFTAWTALIQEVDRLDIAERIQRVYDTFLAEFPLCYGYWKKYADHEGRLGSHESIVAVYERAVQAVTYSVDIWTHYCSYLINKQEDPHEIRRLFERGLSYVGTDYLSHILWDKYLEFEMSLNEINRISQIYTRIIQIPIQQLDRYYHGFKQFISVHTLGELLAPEERAASKGSSVTGSDAEMAQIARSDGGEVIGSNVASVESEGSANPVLTEEEELVKFNQIRDEMYNIAKVQDSRIAEYESAIRRPYFHVKPLDDAQLTNWHHYLDFIEKEGDFSKVVKLYERCLIACANYPEYWVRYVQRMDLEGSMEYAIDALSRATQIFVKRRPEIHLFAARFKEDHGDIDGARFEYQFINSSLAPGLLECVVKSANFEHRQGNTEGAYAIYSYAIEYEKSKVESRSLPLLFVQYARFLDQAVANTDRAREVFAEALNLLPSSKTLWEALIHFEAYRSGPKDLDRLDSLIEQAISPPKQDGLGMNPIDREEVSVIYLEFLDLYADLQRIKNAEARHMKLFPLRKSAAESRKRPLSDVAASDRSKLAKTGSTVSPSQSTTPAYANGQAQWTAAYGQQGYAQPQNWQPGQQAPQVQSQQWSAGYTAPQQVGYTPYGSYGTYAPQQQPVLAAPTQQAAAYGSYPQSYAPQAFPQQQTYNQQAVSAQQGYYAAYY